MALADPVHLARHVSLRVSEDLVSAVDEAARRAGVERGAWIRAAMRERLAERASGPGRPSLAAILEAYLPAHVLAALRRSAANLGVEVEDVIAEAALVLGTAHGIIRRPAGW